MFKLGDRVFHKSAGISMQGNITHIHEEDGSVTVKWADCTCSHDAWCIALVENIEMCDNTEFCGVNDNIDGW